MPKQMTDRMPDVLHSFLPAQRPYKRRRNKDWERSCRAWARYDNLICARATYQRYHRHILRHEMTTWHKKTLFTIEAFAEELLQQCWEEQVVRLLEHCNNCALHAKRITVTAKDVMLAVKLGAVAGFDTQELERAIGQRLGSRCE